MWLGRNLALSISLTSTLVEIRHASEWSECRRRLRFLILDDSMPNLEQDRIVVRMPYRAPNKHFIAPFWPINPIHLMRLSAFAR